MKRGWILASALALLLVGLGALRWAASKRPHLFAPIACWRVITFSPDGTKLFTRQNDDEGEIVDVATKVRKRIATKYLDTDFFFSPDNQTLFQLQTSGYEGFVDDEGTDFRTPIEANPILYKYSIRDGKSLGHIPLLPPEDFYGAYQKGQEIIAQSRWRTWHLDGRTGKILSFQKQNRKLRKVRLTPDGKTLFKRNPKDISFFDLQSQQLLWTWNTLSEEPHFSSDGQLVLAKVKGVLVARDSRTGTKQWRLRGLQNEDDTVAPFALSPNGNFIYEGQTNGEMWIWPVR